MPFRGIGRGGDKVVEAAVHSDGVLEPAIYSCAAALTRRWSDLNSSMSLVLMSARGVKSAVLMSR